MKTNKAKLENLLDHADAIAMEALNTSVELELQMQKCSCKKKILNRIFSRKCQSCSIAKVLSESNYQVYLKLYNATDKLYI